jgi:hypothetical protein
LDAECRRQSRRGHNRRVWRDLGKLILGHSGGRRLLCDSMRRGICLRACACFRRKEATDSDRRRPPYGKSEAGTVVGSLSEARSSRGGSDDARGDYCRFGRSGTPHPEQGFRSCLGILSLARGCGPARLEAACRRGVSIGATSYRSISSILKNGLDKAFLPEIAPDADPIHRRQNPRTQTVRIWHPHCGPPGPNQTLRAMSAGCAFCCS